MTYQELLNNIIETYHTGIDLIKVKNKDYAKENDVFANFRMSETIGISIEQAIMIRMLDKMSRIGNLLTTHNQVKDESINDTLVDLINYTAILKAYLESREKE